MPKQKAQKVLTISRADVMGRSDVKFIVFSRDPTIRPDGFRHHLATVTPIDKPGLFADLGVNTAHLFVATLTNPLGNDGWTFEYVGVNVTGSSAVPPGATVLSLIAYGDTGHIIVLRQRARSGDASVFAEVRWDEMSSYEGLIRGLAPGYKEADRKLGETGLALLWAHAHPGRRDGDAIFPTEESFTSWVFPVIRCLQGQGQRASRNAVAQYLSDKHPGLMNTSLIACDKTVYRTHKRLGWTWADVVRKAITDSNRPELMSI